MMQYSSDMSAMQTCVQEQSPGFGTAFVCAHRALHFAFAMNASTSSLVSMILHLDTQELVQSFMGGPPFVSLQPIFSVLDFEKPRICSSAMKRNILFDSGK